MQGTELLERMETNSNSLCIFGDFSLKYSIEFRWDYFWWQLTGSKQHRN